MVELSKGKGYCFFTNAVRCFHRKSDRSGVFDRCAKCPHYERFMREMEEEEDKFWDEFDRLEREKHG